MIVKELQVHVDCHPSAADQNKPDPIKVDECDPIRLWTPDIELLTQVSKQDDVRPVYALLAETLNKQCYENNLTADK